MKLVAPQSIGLNAASAASDVSRVTATVVVCTRNRPTDLRNCLGGIARLAHPPDEVMVVDNTSGDRESEAVAKEFGAIYVVEPIVGLSRARNRGIEESRSDIVAYLDDDAMPDVHWLQLILEPFKDPQVSTVTGRIVTPQFQAGENATMTTRSLCNRDPEWFGIATFGGLGLGSNMAFRKKACAGQKVFEERLGRGAPFKIAEESYAFAFLLSKGYKTVYVPEAIVFHPDGDPPDVKQEARNSIAYAMLLFAEFPNCRLDLLRYLYGRLRGKPLTWPRESPDPGEIITSGWRLLLSASFDAALLFLRTKKVKDR